VLSQPVAKQSGFAKASIIAPESMPAAWFPPAIIL